MRDAGQGGKNRPKQKTPQSPDAFKHLLATHDLTQAILDAPVSEGHPGHKLDHVYAFSIEHLGYEERRLERRDTLAAEDQKDFRKTNRHIATAASVTAIVVCSLCLYFSNDRAGLADKIFFVFIGGTGGSAGAWGLSLRARGRDKENPSDFDRTR